MQLLIKRHASHVIQRYLEKTARHGGHIPEHRLALFRTGHTVHNNMKTAPRKPLIQHLDQGIGIGHRSLPGIHHQHQFLSGQTERQNMTRHTRDGIDQHHIDRQRKLAKSMYQRSLIFRAQSSEGLHALACGNHHDAFRAGQHDLFQAAFAPDDVAQVVVRGKAQHANHAMRTLMLIQHHHLLAAFGQRSRQIDQRSGFPHAAPAAGQRHNAYKITGQQPA